MSFEAALKAHLQGAQALSDLVRDRIYPVVRPEGSALPAIVYTPFAPDQADNLSGRDGSLRFIRVQVDCWGLAYSDVVSLGDAVRARMDVAAATFRSVLIPGAGFDDFEPDTKLYRRSMDFRCSFTET